MQFLLGVFNGSVKSGMQNVIYCVSKCDTVKPQDLEKIVTSGNMNFERLFGATPGKTCTVSQEDNASVLKIQEVIEESLGSKMEWDSVDADKLVEVLASALGTSLSMEEITLKAQDLMEQIRIVEEEKTALQGKVQQEFQKQEEARGEKRRAEEKQRAAEEERDRAQAQTSETLKSVTLIFSAILIFLFAWLYALHQDVRSRM